MIDEWLEGYIAAWRSDDAEEIAALFTEDAHYYTTPYRPPKAGRDEIVRWWVAQQDSAIEWTFEHSVIAVDGDIAVVRGVTFYPASAEDPTPRTYHNLWTIRLAEDGRATEFVEFWMLEPDDAA